MTLSGEYITLRARCHCEAYELTAILPSSSFPLTAFCCHCTSCRHNLGTLAFTCVEWPDAEIDLSKLRRYVFSPNVDIFSCQTCSSQLFCLGSTTGNKPHVLTGAIQNTEKGLLRYGEHIFVGDAVDGGCSMWLRRDVDGRVLKRSVARTGTSEELPFAWPEAKARDASEDRASPEFTPLWCRCKGVNLLLKSGSDVTWDLGEKPPRYIDPRNKKYVTHIDACNSCRTITGSDLVYWAFAGVDHLYDPSRGNRLFSTITDLEEAVDRGDKRIGTLQRYNSSPGVNRYSCAFCAATIFYTQQDLPQQVDIAVGVLDHPSGPRAEGLLSWAYNEIHWISDTRGGWRESLCMAALDGIKEWRSNLLQEE
ncbi:unnamed protein product [Clonostachys byssicola]|uniref:CENP-V/GFA domain-containing protein n=1 Tax=Clonostachys byssicola TaxID=160290 RepID=A0A9N9Y4J9_9HYPO|nr:unnamed protein product [Clonostachys byssicola]